MRNPETDHAVAIRDLVVIRGDKLVLPEVSLDIFPGTVTGLLGPSGSGKSTLLRAIVGVQRVESGEVTVLGQPAGSAEVRSRVGYVTQGASVYTDLTIEENLAYFRRVLGAPTDSIDSAIETVGLNEERRRVVGSLSGGQRNRVSLAAALLPDPELLVLDEPTVGLDPVLRRELWGAFRRLAARGTTLLISSHVMDEAAECDQLLLMREGHIVAQQSPEALRDATGTDDLSEAFIRLIEREEVTA